MLIPFLSLTAGQPKLLVSQPGGTLVQPRLIVPAQHLTLLTSNGSGATNAGHALIEPKKEGKHACHKHCRVKPQRLPRDEICLPPPG
jgi:hypothetical protein